METAIQDFLLSCKLQSKKFSSDFTCGLRLYLLSFTSYFTLVFCRNLYLYRATDSSLVILEAYERAAVVSILIKNVSSLDISVVPLFIHQKSGRGHGKRRKVIMIFTCYVGSIFYIRLHESEASVNSCRSRKTLDRGNCSASVRVMQLRDTAKLELSVTYFATSEQT